MQNLYAPLLKMPYKFTLFFLLIIGTLLPGLKAQLKPGDRPITIEKAGVKLSDFFSLVWDQTHLQAFYNDEQLSSEEKVNVYFKNEPLDNVLAWLLRKRGLTWYYREETFVILPRKPGDPELGKIPEEPTINITGLVTDKEGQALQNATVIINGTQRGVQTDKAGKFIINKIRKNTALTISCVGFSPKEIAINGDTLIKVQLASLITGLDEVLVIAYGTSTRRELTGAVNKVSGEEMAKQPVADPLLALQGRVPGLNITQTSGLQGSSVKVELRGRNSIAAGNSPLYIVDGIPFPGTGLTLNNILPDGLTISPLGAANPLNMINISDIESIDVLKDADATAIYGSRGANGVILITTKTGKPGKMKMDVNLYTGIGRMANSVQYLDRQQYLQMRNEALKNDNAVPHPYDYDLLRWDTTRYTDWQKVLLGGTAHITDGQLAFSGGGTTNDINIRFRISGGYRKESTVYPSDFSYQKVSGRMNLSISTVNGRGKVNVAAGYVADKNYLPYVDLASLVTLAPSTPAPYDADGKLNWENGTFSVNPMATLLRSYKAHTNNLMANAELSYKVLDNEGQKIEGKINLGYNGMAMSEMQPNPLRSFNPTFGMGSVHTFFGDGTVKSWIAEPQINYAGNWGKSQLKVLAGATFQQEERDQEGITATGFTSDATVENKMAAGVISPLASGYYQYRYNALFGRITYDWDRKYYLNLTGRRDGSSRFGPGNQFANFGSIGAAWIFSEESWMSNALSFLSFGKLRASYGSTGNDQITDYGYAATYTSASRYQNVSGLIPSRLFNANYGWELSKKMEVALELGFKEDQVLFRASYYRNNSSRQLVNYSLSGLSGFNSILNNYPALVRNTGVELELNTVNVKRKDFNWTTSFNISVPNNKLVAFPGIENTLYNYIYTVGQPLNIYKGFHYTGVDAATGLYTFYDADKDGKIQQNSADYIFSKKIGAFWYGGLQNSLQYKNWQLDVLFQFVKQNGYSYLYTTGSGPGVINNNQPIAILDRWQEGGNRTDIQKYSQSVGVGPAVTYFNMQKSDGAITDASFVRLKNLSLSYQLPAKWLQKARLQGVRFYLQGQNVLTFTSFKGRDPEVTDDHNIYPPLRIWTVGLQLSL